jgi:CspA family cold shock protein
MAASEAAERGDPVAQGSVKYYLTDKGYGFIAQAGGPDVFVTATSLLDGVRTLQTGQMVEFDIVQGAKGPEAKNVRLIA